MLTVASYGLPVFRTSSAAYYWEGLNANGVKSTNSGTNIVEAGWLAGLGWTTPLGSNMPTPRVFVYSNPGSAAPTTRFTTPRFPNFVGLYGKCRAVFPTTLATWQVWGPPANAT